MSGINHRQTERVRQKIRRRKKEKEKLNSKAGEKERKQVLQNADRNDVCLAVFVMTLTKEEFHCEMRYPACEKVTPDPL